MNVYWANEDPKETRGFHNIVIGEGYHPYMSNWWPSAHLIGWEHTFVHEFHHFFNAIVNNQSVRPIIRTSQLSKSTDGSDPRRSEAGSNAKTMQLNSIRTPQRCISNNVIARITAPESEVAVTAPLSPNVGTHQALRMMFMIKPQPRISPTVFPRSAHQK